MPGVTEYRWVRVDDRLLHGQVALGWGRALDPEAFLIVDDGVASDPFVASLFEVALPEGTRLVVLDSERFLAGGDSGLSPERTILLIRSLSQLRSLCERGFRPREVNLGGIHHRAGARRFLDYLFLTDEECEALRWLLAQGVVLFAQDLPSSPRRSAEGLLAKGGAAA